MLSNANELINQTEWIGRIKLNELSNTSLILVSKLSRIIKKTNGNNIKLHDESMAIRLAEQVIEIDSPELNKLHL